MRDVATVFRAIADKADELKLEVPAFFEVPYMVLVDKVRNVKAQGELVGLVTGLVKTLGASMGKST